jgi:hypothetical protein
MPLITVSAGTPAIPAGTYPATLISITPKRMITQFSNGVEQDFLDWTFVVEGPERDAEVSLLSTTATGPKSKINMILTALIGPEKASEVGLGLEESDLVGKRVVVSIIEKDGFARIDSLMAPPRVRTAAPVAPPVVAPSAPVEGTDEFPF